MKEKEYVKILDKLLEDKSINKKQYKEVKKEISENDKKLEDVIVNRSLADQEKITEIRAELYEIPYENLTNKTLSKDALNVISYDVAEYYRIVCFELTGDKIKIGMEDPSNFKAIEAMNFLAKGEGKEAEYYLISSISLEQAFKQYKNVEEEIGQALESKVEEEGEDIKVEEGFEESGAGEDEISSAPVARIVSVIVRHAVEGRASDIHIEPVSDNTRVRYRVDGILNTSLVLPKKLHSSIVGRIKVLAKLKIDETRVPQDGRIRLKVNNQRVDFRVSVLPLIEGEKVVMRILSLEKGIPKLEELGFEGRNLDSLKKSIKKTYGILLVTGPTGSGKSTTLASLLSILNKEEINISTLEDPIEYYIEGVNQSQVRPGINYSFATGLRSLLRQDPDIFMVGEVRDKETANLCIHAGLTGHFILSTLHTNNAVDSVSRLLDMDVEPYLLGSTLSGIVAQRLVRKVCAHCKKKESMPEDIHQEIKKEMEAMPKSVQEKRVNKEALEKGEFYKGAGCPHCGNTGYVNRTGIVEVVEITDDIKKIIVENKQNLSVKDVMATQDFITMKQDGIIKVLEGVTTMEEVLRVINR
jgi:type IV pilus assembly protein PilB